MEGSTDTRHIERDLEDTRSRLDATIDALQQKLSPGQMVDQAVTYFKEGGGVEFTSNLGRTVRDNPLPVLLIGAGIAWLAVSGTTAGRRDTGGGERGYRRGRGWASYDRTGSTAYGDEERGYAAEYATPPDYGTPRYDTAGAYGAATAAEPREPLPYEAAAYDDLATKANEAGSRLAREQDEAEDVYQERVYTAKGSVLGVTRQEGEEPHGFRERVEAALSAAADRFRRAAHQAGSMASGAGSRAGGMAGGLAERGQAGLRGLYGYGQSAAYGVRDGAGYASWRARDAGARTTDYLTERPLLLGALGVTLGAVVGMLLPSTRYERQVFGNVREGLKDTAREAMGDVGQRVARVAETVLDTAHDSARREGLSDVSAPGIAAAAREQVADAAGRVRHVVEETATAGREALEREVSGTGGGDDKSSSPGGNKQQSSSAAGTKRQPGGGEHGDPRPVV
jgi:hypothetical protein